MLLTISYTLLNASTKIGNAFTAMSVSFGNKSLNLSPIGTSPFVISSLIKGINAFPSGNNSNSKLRFSPSSIDPKSLYLVVSMSFNVLFVADIAPCISVSASTASSPKSSNFVPNKPTPAALRVKSSSVFFSAVAI